MANDVFEITRDMIDATSMRRPDVGAVSVDAAGHRHPWCMSDGTPATTYQPEERYSVPSLRWIRTGMGCDQDGEEYEVGHMGCIECGAAVQPRYTADECVRHIAGLLRYAINGQSVSREEFEERRRAANLKREP